MLAVSVVTITKLAVRHTTASRGLAIGGAYGLAWGLQQAIAVDFHEVCLAVPLLALSLGALIDHRWRACAVWALPLVLVKEDLGLTVAAIGLCVVLRGQRRIGGGLVAFGVAATCATVLLVMPAISQSGHYRYWKGLTAHGRKATLVVLAAQLLDPPSTKLITLVMVFGITGFLALRSPFALVALPTLAWRFAADVPSYWGTNWHYSAVLMPIVFVALIDAIDTSSHSGWPWMRAYGISAAPIALAVAITLSGQFPVSTLVQPATYRSGAAGADARRALAHIRSDTVVETDPGLMAHLTSRCDVYFITRAGNPAPDYLVVSDAWMPSVTNAATLAQQLHPGIHYALIYTSSNYQVARREQ